MAGETFIDDVVREAAAGGDLRKILTERLENVALNTMLDEISDECDLADQVIAFLDDNATLLDGDEAATKLYRTAKYVKGEGPEPK